MESATENSEPQRGKLQHGTVEVSGAGTQPGWQAPGRTLPVTYPTQLNEDFCDRGRLRQEDREPQEKLSVFTFGSEKKSCAEI